MSDDSLSIDEAEDGIQVYFDEIKEKDKLLRDAVYNLSKASSKEQRDTLIKKAESAYKGAKENISFAKDDLNDYTGNKKRTFQQELKKLEQSVSKNYADLTQIKENREPAAGSASPANSTTSSSGNRKPTKTSGSTNDVPSAGKSSGTKNQPKRNDDHDEIQITNLDDDDNGGGSGPKQMQKGHSRVDEVLDIYDKNNDMLNNMIKMGDEMIQVGAAAAEKLRQQTERMNAIQKDLDDLGDGLKRAKKELNAFMRGTACDKAVVIIFIIVIIAMVLLIIGWQIAKYFCIKGSTNKCIAGFTASNTTSLLTFMGFGSENKAPAVPTLPLIEVINIPTSEVPILREMKKIE
ncbi:predicted protein [Naegleria gruberi]|uniref:Predicted protein n=1 Tax=Naegleria gruberi TaxID=5762 RepID=D2VZV0_NAEGR|nr:uncharacterized protein NAEGRDRAFT_74626 [Naegleria gruberi]EFC37634.1 predicted protein [Naegleria gruberi]|eukprot:XP_002670378.1 predicted protein [Naegleria gruberi strain NEG-M]